MNKRERLLLWAAGCAIILWLGFPMLDSVFVEPIREKRQQLELTHTELVDQTQTLTNIRRAVASLEEWRSRSLPPAALDAQRLYQAWLTDTAQQANFKKVKVTPGLRKGKGDVFTGVMVNLKAKGTLSQLNKFLLAFYRMDMAHRIKYLKIKSESTTGDPLLDLEVNAEGLTVAGASPRATLFPETSLINAVAFSEQNAILKVESTNTFPEQPGFSISIGDSEPVVRQIAGNEWTLESNENDKSQHGPGAVVKLLPLHKEFGRRTPDDFSQLLENSPFTKPVPEVVVAKETPQEKPKMKDKSAAETYLAASVRQGEEYEAWLYRNAERTVLRKESKLKVGEINAVVVDIQPEFMMLNRDGKIWRLTMGDTIDAMTAMPEVDSPRDESKPAVQ